MKSNLESGLYFDFLFMPSLLLYYYLPLHIKAQMDFMYDFKVLFLSQIQTFNCMKKV